MPTFVELPVKNDKLPADMNPSLPIESVTVHYGDILISMPSSISRETLKSVLSAIKELG